MHTIARSFSAVRASHKENHSSATVANFLIDLFGPFTPACHGIDIKGTSQSRPAKWVVKSISARSTRRDHESAQLIKPHRRSFAQGIANMLVFRFSLTNSHPFLVTLQYSFLPAVYQGLSLNCQNSCDSTVASSSTTRFKI